MTAEVVIFPDVEQVISDWLRTTLAALDQPISVSTRVPSPRPSTFVRVLRTGGTTHTVITDAAQITIESFAEYETDGALLAQLVRGLLNSLPGRLPIVCRVDEGGGPINFPDPITAQVRYQQTFVIHLRGLAAPINTGETP